MEVVSSGQINLNNKAGDDRLIEKLDKLAEIAARDLMSDGVLLSVLQNSTFYSLGAYPRVDTDLNARAHNADDTGCIHTVNRGGPLRITDAREDTFLRRSKYVKDGLIVGYMAIPIVNPQFGNFGSICAISHTPREWSQLELNYLQQTAKNVELLLLEEMSRLELESFSTNLSDVDRIVATLSSSTVSPTSIYEQSGALVFANAALLEIVPEAEVARFCNVEMRRTIAPLIGGAQIGRNQSLGECRTTINTVSDRKRLVDVSIVLSNSGLIVCSWRNCLTAVD